VIKGDGEAERYHEENCEDHLIMRTNHTKTGEVGDENYEFGRDHINQDRSDEEALLTFKDNRAGRAPVLDLEQLFGD
jgi:hypothetical protein